MGAGKSKGAVVAKATGVARATTMMRDNHYGWFEKIEVGVYGLSDAGRAACGCQGVSLLVSARPRIVCAVWLTGPPGCHGRRARFLESLEGAAVHCRRCDDWAREGHRALHSKGAWADGGGAPAGFVM